MFRPVRRLLVVSSLATALLLVAACGGGDDDGEGVEISAAGGGTVSSADGALTLEIPAGALANDTEITIALVSPDDYDDDVVALGPVGPVYELRPDGVTFATPVTLTLELDVDDLSGVVDFDGELSPILVASRSEDGTWSLPDSISTTFDFSGQSVTVTAQISHFSVYIAWPLNGFVRPTFEPSAFVGEVGDEWIADLFVKNVSTFPIGIEQGQTAVGTSAVTGVVIVVDEEAPDIVGEEGRGTEETPPATLVLSPGPTAPNGVVLTDLGETLVVSTVFGCDDEGTGTYRVEVTVKIPRDVLDEVLPAGWIGPPPPLIVGGVANATCEEQPLLTPTPTPTPDPIVGPTATPTPAHTLGPIVGPTLAPTPALPLGPFVGPTPTPTPTPTPDPTVEPTATATPTVGPTPEPEPGFPPGTYRYRIRFFNDHGTCPPVEFTDTFVITVTAEGRIVIFQPSTGDESVGTVDADGNVDAVHLNAEQDESNPIETYQFKIPRPDEEGEGAGTATDNEGVATYLNTTVPCKNIWDVELTLISFDPIG